MISKARHWRMYSHVAAATTEPAIKRYHDVKPWANAASKHSRTKLTSRAVIAQFDALRVDRTHNQNLRCGRCQLARHYSIPMTLRFPVTYNPTYFILPWRSYMGVIKFIMLCIFANVSVYRLQCSRHWWRHFACDSGYWFRFRIWLPEIKLNSHCLNVIDREIIVWAAAFFAEAHLFL